MGEKYVFNWFGKSVDELKAIRETENLSPKHLEELDKLIAKKEKEANESK